MRTVEMRWKIQRLWPVEDVDPYCTVSVLAFLDALSPLRECPVISVILRLDLGSGIRKSVNSTRMVWRVAPKLILGGERALEVPL